MNDLPSKPLGLLSVLVRQSSSPSELVVDPFTGSGTTGVAALQFGRRFLGADISAGAVEVARRRLAGGEVTQRGFSTVCQSGLLRGVR